MVAALSFIYAKDHRLAEGNGGGDASASFRANVTAYYYVNNKGQVQEQDG
jgi:hypothetical protein